ncbi:MAG: cell division protein FtsZ, partial [Chloroflexota bacterium]|nr:cell division protein FtsZ [Chloroflexota bacterium]
MPAVDLASPPLLVSGAVLIFLIASALSVAVVRRRRPGSQRTVSVVGIGDGGANAVRAAMRARTPGVQYVAINTDEAALGRSRAQKKILIGMPGQREGAGGDPTVGELAARDAAEEIKAALAGSDLVVITSGLGGGTGSGAAPVVAEIARQQGALTIAVLTKPFAFEGTRRHHVAERAMKELMGKVDAVAVLPNERVRDTVSGDVSIDDAFRAIDEMLRSSIQAILDMVAAPGRISLDFGNARSVLKAGGAAFVGFGRAAGEHRAAEAAHAAMAAALLDAGMEGASSIVLNVKASRRLKLSELDEAVQEVIAATGTDADVVLGMTIDERLGQQLQVTLIATGFRSQLAAAEVP